MTYKNFIFDFDGTMLNSGMFTFEFVQRHCKKPMDLDQMRAKTSKEALEFFGFSPIQIIYLMLKGRRELLKNHKEIGLEPGIQQLVADLVANKLPIYIVSSNSKKNIRTILSTYNLLPHIRDISSSIGVHGKGKKLIKLIKKHGLDPKTTIYIGDETRDIVAAHKSGIAAGAVSWGYNSLEVLKKYNPEFSFTHPGDIGALAGLPPMAKSSNGGE